MRLRAKNVRTPAPGRVALLMSDTREPKLQQWAAGRCTVPREVAGNYGVDLLSLTYLLNAHYAQKHGYDLFYYRLLQDQAAADTNGSIGCRHQKWGPRHPSYCKVAVIGHLLRRVGRSSDYDWIVFLDSDAFISPNATALSLPKLLRAYGARPRMTAYFGWDYPYSLGPNMAFIAMRNTRLARDLVNLWWNLDPSTFSLEHPYEQHLMQWIIIHTRRFRSQLQTLHLHTSLPQRGDAVVHADHNEGTKTRIWLMARAVAEMLCASRHGQCDRSHVPRQGRPVTDLGAALKTLHGNRHLLQKGRRASAVQVVLREACKSFKAAGSHPRLKLIHRFDVTRHASSMTMAATESTAVVRQGGSLLDGVPLQLSNCSNDPEIVPWQTWTWTWKRVRGRAHHELGNHPCKGRCATTLRLMGQPELCLALGESRAPRTPYATLAQLAPCTSTDSADLKGWKLRSQLHYDASTSFLQTSHSRAELAQLPGQRIDCGFWSSCTGLHTILPKPCWKELASNPKACGKHEPTLLNMWVRYRNQTRWPGYRNFTLGPDGPAPWPTLLRRGPERMCLRSWRALFEPRAAVVFQRCPQRRTYAKGEGKWHAPRLFEWELRSHGDAVRVVPRPAPELCLSVPGLPTIPRAPRNL